MAVDPHVSTRLWDRPRSGTPMPPARGFRAQRPAEVVRGGQPSGPLLGAPGPDEGYALLLAQRFHDRLHLAPGEDPADAVAAAAAIAMRRAAGFGRAPVLADVEFGFSLLGYLGEAPPDLVEWRRLRVRGAAHDYVGQRELVDAVKPQTLALQPGEVRECLARWRELVDTSLRA